MNKGIGVAVLVVVTFAVGFMVGYFTRQPGPPEAAPSPVSIGVQPPAAAPSPVSVGVQPPAAVAPKPPQVSETPKVGKVIYTQKFESPAPNFKGQGDPAEIVDGGVDGSKAFSFGPKGFSVWNEWSTPVKESTKIRFKLKPLFEPKQITVMVFSKKLSDNCRYNISNCKKDQWTQVEFRAMDCHVGWSMSGPGMAGSDLENLTILFDGAPSDRLLIDDIEVCE